jgi:hypothetical protein
MAPNIYSGPVRAVFELMEASTAHQYYRAELIDVTGYSGPTIDKATSALYETGFVRREQKHVDELTNRATANLLHADAKRSLHSQVTRLVDVKDFT